MSNSAEPLDLDKEESTWPVAAADGEIARILLAFLATAGLFYVNIMPALVSGLIEGLGFTNQQAGFVGSANVYGAALGALAAVFLVKHIRWKSAAWILLLGLMLMDFISINIDTAQVLIGVRFVHGCMGGLLVGIGFSIISRTKNAERTFGYLLTVQFGLGGAGLMILPGLVPEYGVSALFFSLMGFSFVTLLMLPFLGQYPVKNRQRITTGKTNAKLLLLTLLATFLFQAANMGIYAYMIGMGEHYGLQLPFISSTLGVAAWIAIAGSVLVIVMSTKYGRLWPLSVAILLTAIGTWLLHFSGDETWFWLANVLVGITWAFVISYLLAMCSAFDETGQMAALGGFASKMGMASGPFVAALLLTQDDYSLVINLAGFVLVLCFLVIVIPAAALDKTLTAGPER